VIHLATERLRHEAAIRGWDQRALAHAAGVSEGTVSRVLAGRRMRAITALCIVQALRQQPIVPELAELIPLPTSGGHRPHQSRGRYDSTARPG
jgi:transcriptional regulator with XRE-family HTH domain